MNSKTDTVKEAIIIFADLISSSRISDVVAPSEFSRIIAQFQTICNDSLSRLGREKIIPEDIYMADASIRGEEAYLCLVLDENNKNFNISKKRSALAAIEFAVDLSINWFYCQLNATKIENKASPVRIAIGIHYGKVFVTKTNIGEWTSKTNWKVLDEKKTLPFGSSINFAKRIETASRQGKATGIAVSQSFIGVCRDFGIPIFVGEPLDTEQRGFENSESIYEIIGQDVINENGKIIESKQLDLLEKAFTRDPSRNYWLLELAAESLFLFASNDKTLYKRAIDFAELAIGLDIKKDQMFWRAAMSYHRWRRSETDIDIAINYYTRAAQNRSMIWAQYDLASAFWVRAQSTKTVSQADNELHRALEILNAIVVSEPRHFHSFNLRALVLADLVNICNRQDVNLNQASSDLSIATHLHPGTGFLYQGSLAYVEKARKKPDQALKALDRARTGLSKVVQSVQLDDGSQTQFIPSELFWKQGLLVPAYHPPRPEKLIQHWKSLEQKIST